MYRQLILLALAAMVLGQRKQPALQPAPVEDHYSDEELDNILPASTSKPKSSVRKPLAGKVPKPPSPQAQAPASPYDSLSVEELLKRPLDTEALQQILVRAQPGKDYPVYSLDALPQTSFSCDNVHYPGYYADIEAGCQVFHFCPPRLEGMELVPQSYICPNLTIFNNRVLVCDWFFNVDCPRASELYDLANSRLYQTVLPLLDDVPDVQSAPVQPVKPAPRPPKRTQKPLKQAPLATTEVPQESYDVEQ